MTNKIDHDDRIGHIACYFSHCGAIISSLAKVMGACKVVKNKDPNLHLLKEHSSRHGKVIQDDHSDNMSHNACYF